jgi:hypothetical protein
MSDKKDKQEIMSNEDFQKAVLENFKVIKSQLDENTQILKALEHKAEINKAEHDKMSNDIAHMQGDITSIKNVVTIVEEVTAQNWNDIIKLKKAK